MAHRQRYRTAKRNPMIMAPRRRFFTLFLALLLAGVMSPTGLHAVTGHRQDTSSTTKTKKKHKKSESKKSSAENSTAKPASSKSATAEAKTSKRSYAKSKESERAKESSSTPAAASASKSESAAPKTEARTKSSHETTTTEARTPPSPGMVWVNTSSKVYHKSGSRWYGKTKEGKWMNEADAQKSGYRAAKN